MSSLAQDELGHAAGAVRAARRGHGRRPTPTRSPTTATPAEYRHARLLDHGRGDWAMTIARRYLYETADAVRLEALADGSWPPLRRAGRQDPARGALPPDARRPWLERLADARRRAARRLVAALESSGPTPARCSRRSPGSRHWSTAASSAASMAELERDWRAADRADIRAARPPAPPPTRDPAAAGPTTARRSAGCTASSRPSAAATPERPGERGRHARGDRPARPARTASRLRRRGRPRRPRRGPRPGDPGRCRSSTSGSSHRVEVDERRHPRRDPARRSSVARRSTSSAARSRTGCRRFGLPVRVDTTFEVPWTSDRISPTGRARARGGGHRPADREPDDVRCPFCASARVVMDSAFGPTQCRSLFYCRACRQPFEALKAV